jgi:hypothetical protein
MDFDELVAEHTLHVAHIAHKLRGLIRSSMPGAEERVYPGWHGVGYHDAVAGYVCAIFPKADVVEVAFERGRDLSPRGDVFDRTGKQVGYLSFARWDPAKARKLEELIDRAAALAR